MPQSEESLASEKRFLGWVMIIIIVATVLFYAHDTYEAHRNAKPDFYSEDQIQLRQHQQEISGRGTTEQCLAWNQSWSSQPQMQRNCADVTAP